MKHCFVLITAVFWVLTSMVRAEGPDDEYIRIYNLIQQADDQSRLGRLRDAYESYQTAQAALQHFQEKNPNWSPKLIQFRLESIKAKLSQFAPSAERPLAENPAPASSAKPLTPAEIEARIKTLDGDVVRLAADKKLLEAKLQEALSAQPGSVDPRQLAKAEEKIKSLQKENELLKVALDRGQGKAAKLTDATKLEEAQKALAEANRKLAEQTKALAALTEEKRVLQARVASPKDSKTVASLKADNATLEKKLAAAEASLKNRPAGKTARQPEDLARQNASLQAKLDSLEARKVPYTPEELALFKGPPPTVAAVAPPEKPAEKPAAEVKGTKPVKKTVKDLPPGTGSLEAEARRAFLAGRSDEAEKKYLQILSMDEKNVYVLGNLAAVEIQQNRLDVAEANLSKALSVEPDDAYSLSLMGIIKFRNGKLDGALDVLSRSAKIDPLNAETQNYLGITLSQQGQREAAETALRKAVQLSPKYGSAHHNLAIVYATQKPPFMELARYHYQKALEAGHPKNPELEQILAGQAPPSEAK